MKLSRRLGGPVGERLVRREMNSPNSLVICLNGSPEPNVLVKLAGSGFPTHNGQLLDHERVAINDSTANMFRIFSRAGEELASHAIPGRWLRGLEPIDDHRVLLGSAPASVSLLDLERRCIVNRLELSADPNEAVHGLTLCPEPAERQ